MSSFTRRAITLVPTILGVVTLVFFLIHLIPGDPVEVMLGERASAADMERLRSDLGLDRPLARQYGDFILGLLRGDLGDSFFYRRPVHEVILDKLPATLELALAAMAITVLISIPIGTIAAVRKETAVDRSTMFASLIGISIPNFWLGPMLAILFSVKLGWLPVSGREGLMHIILPAVTLGTGLAAILSRMTRSSMLDVLGEDYLRTARAKGLPESRVILKHALRNALLPVITIVGLQLGALLSGAVITEIVFEWPGIGSLLIEAITSRDYPLVQGCILVVSLGYVAANFLADILYAVVDPRVKT